MVSTISKEVMDDESSKTHAAGAIELYPQPKGDQRSALGPIGTARRLDVDAVLERSVRKAVSE